MLGTLNQTHKGYCIILLTNMENKTKNQQKKVKIPICEKTQSQIVTAEQHSENRGILYKSRLEFLFHHFSKSKVIKCKPTVYD